MEILKAPYTEPVLYFINSLFDLKLGNYPTKKIKKSSSQLELLFPAAVEPHDLICSKLNIDNNFYSYLEQNKISHGRLTQKKDLKKVGNLVNWGWDCDAKSLSKELNAMCLYPSVDTVRNVNSRRLCFEFNEKTNTGVESSNYCSSQNELFKALDKFGGRHIVIKPDFGNAGYGFIQSDNGQLLKDDLNKVTNLFRQGVGVIVEPWLKRIADLSSGFILSQKGDVLTTWHHQTLCNQRGTYFANFVTPQDSLVIRHKKDLEIIIFQMAKFLYKQNYFGPVGFDSFIYIDSNGHEKIAAAIEINARLNAGMIARSVLNKTADKKPAIYRFISKKRHKLIDSYDSLKNILGDIAYNPDNKMGVLLVSPSKVDFGYGEIRTARCAFSISAETNEDVFRLDKELRKRIATS